MTDLKPGVLALQGAVTEHISALSALDVKATEVRLPDDLENIDCLIIPGGESTSISKLMHRYNLTQAIHDKVKSGMPVMGTCAGLILLATKVDDPDLEPLGLMDIEVQRNAYGRQTESFETDIIIPALGEPAFHCIFIRAPLIMKVNSGEPLCFHNGHAVAVRQDNMIACSFHPELADDLRLHEYFLKITSDGILCRN